MLRPLHIVCLLVFGFLFSIVAAVDQQHTGPADRSLDQLEQRLAEIDAQLEQLAAYSLRSGIGSVGYQSKTHTQPFAKEWVRIELDRERPVDQIVLVPTIGGDSKEGFQAKAFPVSFRILAGSGQTTNVVATFTEEDGLLPRLAPLVVSCDSINASWVGVEATELSLRGMDLGYGLELSEIMVFNGLENVALGRPVSVSSSKQVFKARNERFLTDGFVPYMMDSANGTGSGSVGFRSREQFPHAILIIDLQEPCPINQINLHALDTYRTVPETSPNDSTTPPLIRVTGANRSDFSDSVPLLEFRHESVYTSGPIIMRRFPEKTCRYVRLDLLEFQRSVFTRDRRFIAGFSEIEVLSKGRNVALEKPVTGENLPNQTRDLALLTDGNNYFGKILPMRVWMNQLALRHELEKERPGVATELNRRYTRQKRNLNIMYWLAALLGAGTVFVVLLERNARERAASRIRDRIAADLHDELGATLHAVGLYSDLANQEIHDANGNKRWNKLAEYVNEIRALSEYAAQSTRYCTNMLEAKELYENPAEQMKTTAEQLLVDLEHNISFTGGETLKALPPRRRVGLILFYKECLTNIIRHSEATRVKTGLTADRKEVVLTVQDNGKGITTAPPSLKRRARMLKGRLSVDSSAEAGTKTSLYLKLTKSFIKKANQ